MRRGVAKVKKERKAPEATITAMLPVEDKVYRTGWQARPSTKKCKSSAIWRDQNLLIKEEDIR